MGHPTGPVDKFEFDTNGGGMISPKHNHDLVIGWGNINRTCYDERTNQGLHDQSLIFVLASDPDAIKFTFQDLPEPPASPPAPPAPPASPPAPPAPPASPPASPPDHVVPVGAVIGAVIFFAVTTIAVIVCGIHIYRHVRSSRRVGSGVALPYVQQNE